eukprot:10454104-Ditylum_brightwellii.AAC.1
MLSLAASPVLIPASTSSVVVATISSVISSSFQSICCAILATWSTNCEFVSDKLDTVEWSSSVAAAYCAMASAVCCCMSALTLLAV